MLISKQPTRLFLKYDRYSTVIVCDTIENSRICCCICSENTKIKITLQNICNTLDAIYHALSRISLENKDKKEEAEINENSSLFVRLLIAENRSTQYSIFNSAVRTDVRHWTHRPPQEYFLEQEKIIRQTSDASAMLILCFRSQHPMNKRIKLLLLF